MNGRTAKLIRKAVGEWTGARIRASPRYPNGGLRRTSDQVEIARGAKRLERDLKDLFYRTPAAGKPGFVRALRRRAVEEASKSPLPQR